MSYVLLVWFTTLTAPHNSGMTQINGFNSKESCEKAGEQIKEKKTYFKYSFEYICLEAK